MRFFYRKSVMAASVAGFLASAVWVWAGDVTGKWKSEFDTQIGKQKYRYDFKVDGDKLTGRAVGDIAGEKSDTEISQGKIKGVEISFVETVKFQGQDIRVDYTGKVAGDEIKFTRKVGEFATEEMVAKRVTDPASK